MPRIEHAIDIHVPLHAAYKHLSRFEEYPRFLPDLVEARHEAGRLALRTSIAGQENGPARGIVTQQPEPDGPHCVDIGGGGH